MNPPPMEIMFLILSGVILAAGVLYWFWSHIQLTQKKVLLLENAVFELRGMVGPSGMSGMSGPSGPSGPSGMSGPSGPSDNVPAPMEAPAEYKDLDDDDWADKEPVQTVQSVPMLSAMAPLPPTVTIAREEAKEEQFRELFVNDTDKPEENQTLEGLPLKELRRMATERGIVGAAELKKKEVIAALRNTVTALTPSSVEVEKMVEVTVLE